MSEHPPGSRVVETSRVVERLRTCARFHAIRAGEYESRLESLPTGLSEQRIYCVAKIKQHRDMVAALDSAAAVVEAAVEWRDRWNRVEAVRPCGYRDAMMQDYNAATKALLAAIDAIRPDAAKEKP